MAEVDFNSWLARHAARFAGVSRMLQGDPTIGQDWRKRLDRFSVEDLNRATEDLMARDPQPFPEEHLGKIITLCSTFRFKPKRTQPIYRSEPTFNCPDCHDKGVIWVFDAIAYQAIRDECFDEKRHDREIVVACTCHVGQRFSDKPPEQLTEKHHRNMLTFDKRVMLPTKGHTTLDLIEFVQAMKPKNYRSEFSGFEPQ